MQLTREMMEALIRARERRARWLFWSDPTRWPLPWNEGIHLTWAVHEVGRAMYGDIWTRMEPFTTNIGELPPLADFFDTDSNRATVSALLVLARRRAPTLALIHDDQPEPFTPEEYEDARAAASQWASLGPERLQRLVAVFEAVRIGLGRGEIISMLRPADGGAYSDPLPKGNWQTENPIPRFIMGKMDPAAPFARAFDGPNHQWIFVTRDSLASFIERHGPSINADAPAVSAALSVSEQQQLAAPRRRSPTQEQIERLLRVAIGIWRESDTDPQYRISKEDFEAVARKLYGTPSGFNMRSLVLEAFKIRDLPDDWKKQGNRKKKTVEEIVTLLESKRNQWDAE